MEETLGKDEKLKGRKLIQLLFAEGNRVKSYPIQLVYIQNKLETEKPVKVGFSVPKRNVKLAVNRNRIKRLMREVYRKNKFLFWDEMNTNYYVFMFIYMAKEEIPYADLEKALQQLCVKFTSKINENEQI
ncbi:MAG: ribonuclease P protein component [Lutibacter sp.]|nr:ribonuclease P protein component [Lutibacter sp.]MBP9601097.1 ribonuclease P protein component [Lutibacter sp.]